MIKLKTLIEDVVVEEESEAATQAKQLGLTSAGWGTWKDNSGATVAKTVQGKLVKIDPMQGDGNTEPSDGTDISPSDSGVPKLSSMVPSDVQSSQSNRQTKPSSKITQQMKSLPGFAGDHEFIDSLQSHTDARNAMKFYQDAYNSQRGTFDVDADVSRGDAFGNYNDSTTLNFDNAADAWPYLKFDETGRYTFNTKQYAQDNQNDGEY